MKSAQSSRKPLTEDQKNAATDKRIQKKYGITLARREQMRAEQHNRCKMCGREFTAEHRACIDHFHFKIDVCRPTIKDIVPVGHKWIAQAYDEQGDVVLFRSHKTQVGARREIKEIMLPRSIRGLLCNKCNYGLGCIERFFDAARYPENLLPVIEYLRNRLDKSITA